MKIIESARRPEFLLWVEASFALAYQIEARFAQARAQVYKLTSSFLDRAFKGES